MCTKFFALYFYGVFLLKHFVDAVSFNVFKTLHCAEEMSRNIAVNLVLCLFQYTGLIVAGLGMAAVGFAGESLSKHWIL